MRTAKVLLMSLALALLVPVSAATQEETKATVDITGEWEFESETQRGPMTTRITFRQEGDKLEGEMDMRGERVRFTGSVTGNAFTFTISRTMGERSMQLTYNGTVEGEAATGTITSPRGTTPFRARKLT